MELNSLTEKVKYLLFSAKNKTDDDDTLAIVKSLIKEHSDERVLGKIFGYSVSDYAIASLKWMDTEKSIELFNEEYGKLADERKEVISWLIANNYHLEM